MVHQYKLNGYNIVLDTASGSVHAVDEVAYDIIEAFPTHTEDEIVGAILEKYNGRCDVTREDVLDCISDVRSLIDAGKLFSEDKFESLAYNYKNNSNVIKAMCQYHFPSFPCFTPSSKD